ncbi:CCDC90 family protein [Methylocystis sp. MJC1]|jgi:hypothetical protein|uniref:hypothetical protein n=1 Tax=Methylocystis sp. MJC1 TaxID=2654282 RepID=UPI0013EBBC45|nr:hypothetical protein [Methylocystis sp. MJC1]KAF2992769.1 hypothetical protein MJC1_00348 [Methylocystis sp. MJC1]MBU6526731.1 hypothetical protein [Methylocystis sp. MJC1]UZX13168.1 CCDC90 family protein [Methylocystis sp. MJC1]
MTTAGLTFDRLAYMDRLREAGFDEKQARAHAEALDAALRDSVATKADVDRLETKLEAKMETLAANLKVEILRWLFVTQIALLGVLLAAMKFMK